MRPQEERQWKTRKTRIDGRLEAQQTETLPKDSMATFRLEP
jgi:hypothetical protein